MATSLSGRCLCGGVHFSVPSQTPSVVSCFCQHCSKGAGGPSQTMAHLSRKDLTISSGEELITIYKFTDTTSGKPKEKAFCKTCGAPLWTVLGSVEGSVFVRTPLISEWSVLKPGTELFTKNRADWVQKVEAAVQCEEAS